jgi:transcriptional regulator with XRE-family HTH domain
MDQRSEGRASTVRAQALGAAIRRHRGDMNQTAMAGRLGLSQSAISQWETGVIQVTCEHIVELERIFGLKAGTLLVEAGYLDESLLGIDAARRYALWKLQQAVALLSYDDSNAQQGEVDRRVPEEASSSR